MRRRVVVTGIGGVTPLGVEVREIWDGLLRGQSGVGPITLFDASRFPVRIAAEVRNWSMDRVVDDPAPWARHARQTQFAVAAALQASRAAGLPDAAIDPLRIGVFLGCGEIFPDFGQFCRLTAAASHGGSLDLERFVGQARLVARGDDNLILEPSAAAGCIAAMLDAQGPHANFTAACVSSSKAIGEGAEVIRRGDADVMLCGGSHSMIHPFGITGFQRLSTLSTQNDDPEKASRPFENDRDGFVVGEGGAVLVMEELDHARKRGVEIWAEITGWGTAHDAFRITDLEPEGRAAARCMTLALADAGLAPEDIDYINAHGSGTAINDRVETLATKRALGNCAYHVPISSTKSMTGHLTTACGAVEALICIMALRDNAVPPTINYETPDPDCDLDYVPNAARQLRCRHAMSNNFGFGGQNTSLIFSRLAA
ncbi:MAG TPA: beta-ketoacyl-[acyl-carrier-protein] synthase family protein [Candidatus Anammoximicrobium sp.]|nr:beta-ketoacyl-[acyl-carrier-protein] synthase family protein [Candidatus Anammoximicrobium sp.]